MIYLYIFSPLITLLLLLIVSIISWRLRPAIFVSEDQMPNETLKGKHNDWWWIIAWVPRRWSAILNDKAKKHRFPKQLLGSNKRIDGHQDVPLPGTWCLSWPFHFVYLKQKDDGRGSLRAIGIRKDYYGDDDDQTDDDDYWTLRLCWHNVSVENMQYLETLRPKE